MTNQQDNFIPASCHPDRRHVANGLCRRCYGFADYEAKRRDQTYGLSNGQYQVMLDAQDGRCAICHRTETTTRNGRIRAMVVDHDHACCPGKKSCGKCVRGLLCNACNQALGLMGDDSERLIAASRYLQG